MHWLNSPVFDAQDLLMEVLDTGEAGRIGHRVDDEAAIPFPHVLLSHRAELFLTGGVQNWKKVGSCAAVYHTKYLRSL